MKQTKLMLSIALLSFAGLSTTLTSCGTDDVACPVGYEGKDCKELSRDKFIGTWKGNEACAEGTDEYQVKISTSGTSEIKILIDNIYNQNFEATGTMSSSNTFDFSGNWSGGGTVATYNGKGSLNAAGELVLDYKITGAAVNECVFTGSKL